MRTHCSSDSAELLAPEGNEGAALPHALYAGGRGLRSPRSSRRCGSAGHGPESGCWRTQRCPPETVGRRSVRAGTGQGKPRRHAAGGPAVGCRPGKPAESILTSTGATFTNARQASSPHAQAGTGCMRSPSDRLSTPSSWQPAARSRVGAANDTRCATSRRPGEARGAIAALGAPLPVRVSRRRTGSGLLLDRDDLSWVLGLPAAVRVAAVVPVRHDLLHHGE